MNNCPCGLEIDKHVEPCRELDAMIAKMLGLDITWTKNKLTLWDNDNSCVVAKVFKKPVCKEFQNHEDGSPRWTQDKYNPELWWTHIDRCGVLNYSSDERVAFKELWNSFWLLVENDDGEYEVWHRKKDYEHGRIITLEYEPISTAPTPALAIAIAFYLTMKEKE